MKRTAILLLLLTGFTSVSQARDFKYLLSIGFEQGGAAFPGTTLKAGDAAVYSAGILIPVWKKTFLKSMVGWRGNTDSSLINSPEFSTTPIDIIATHFLRKQHQIGLGITYHMSPKLSCSTGTCNSIAFDNSTGYIAEYQWIYGDQGYKSPDYGSVAVRYTSLNYNKNTYSIDASNIGIYLVGGF